jgi:hypothetical protein
MSYRYFWGISVSKISDYRLDDRATGVRSPTEDISSSLCVQTSSEAHLAPYPVGSVGIHFPRFVKPGYGIYAVVCS